MSWAFENHKPVVQTNEQAAVGVFVPRAALETLESKCKDSLSGVSRTSATAVAVTVCASGCILLQKSGTAVGVNASSIEGQLLSTESMQSLLDTLDEVFGHPRLRKRCVSGNE